MFQKSNLPLYFRVPFQLSLLQEFSYQKSILVETNRSDLDPLFLELPRMKQESEYRDFIQSTPMGKTYYLTCFTCFVRIVISKTMFKATKYKSR